MDDQNRFFFEEFFAERMVFFKRLTLSLLGLIAATFVLMLWVLGSPDSYHEHVAEQPPAATWPDGSAKTPGSTSGSPALAQQPAPAQPASQPQQPGG